jgi:hypothetical protein
VIAIFWAGVVFVVKRLCVSRFTRFMAAISIACFSPFFLVVFSAFGQYVLRFMISSIESLGVAP